MTKQLVILSGPSCVGKGPLAAAIKEFRTDIEYDEKCGASTRPTSLEKPAP